MPILAQNGSANPQNVSTNPASTTVSAVLLSTDLSPTPVQVSYTSGSQCASVVAGNQGVTIPAATSFLSPGQLPISQQVQLTSTGARPCIVAVDVKVWRGAVGDPAGPEAMTVALVNLL